MNRTLMLMGLIAAMACPADSRRPERKVLVRLAAPLMQPGVLEHAMVTAQGLFERAGIRLEWAWLETRAVALPIAACMDRGLASIDAEIIEKAPAGRPMTALGAAQPFTSSGVRVRLFEDRFAPLVRSLHRANAGLLIGHALAHEIGHVLIGWPGHSDSGLMTGHWDRHAVGKILARRLEFSAADIEIMHRNLDNPVQCTDGAGFSEPRPSRHSSPSTQTVALARD